MTQYNPKLFDLSEKYAGQNCEECGKEIKEDEKSLFRKGHNEGKDEIYHGDCYDKRMEILKELDQIVTNVKNKINHSVSGSINELERLEEQDMS